MKKSLRQLLDRSAELTLKNPLYRECVRRYTLDECERETPDITASRLFPKPFFAKALIRSQGSGVLAGREEIKFFLESLNVRCSFFKKDRAHFRSGEKIAAISGDVRKILLAERTALNLLGRMSGVAAYAEMLVRKAKKANPKIEVACTRKTMLGLMDKKACSIGGGLTHRLNLSDAVMIKDNHRAAFGRSIEAAIDRCCRKQTRAIFFEIECDTQKQAVEAAQAIQKISAPSSWIVMFDNFTPGKISETLARLKILGLSRGIFFEASGGINEKNIAVFARSGADVLSLGAITKQAAALDFSLEMEEL